MKETKDQSLANSLSDPWKESFEEGRFSFLDGLIYHRTKHSSVITIVHRHHVNTILHKYYENVSSGHFSEYRTLERVKDNAWWLNLNEDTSEYCSTCERFQKANKATAKRFGLLTKIEEPSNPWDVINMGWVTSLSPGGNCSCNAFLAIVDRFSKTPLLIPFFKEDSAMDTAIILWHRVFSRTRIPGIIISDRDPKFTSGFWTGLQNMRVSYRDHCTIPEMFQVAAKNPYTLIYDCYNSNQGS